MSILYVHVLYFPIHASSFFKPFFSPPPCLHIIQLSPFFSCLKNVFPRLIIPPSCSSVPSLAPPLSLSPSFTVFLSFLLQLLFIVGYRCSLCLFLKDYLRSHLDEGFGKGSLSTPSFRGPMHGRQVHEGGRVCAFVCVYLSVLVMYIHVCACVLVCWAVIKSKRSQQWRMVTPAYACVDLHNHFYMLRIL